MKPGPAVTTRHLCHDSCSPSPAGLFAYASPQVGPIANYYLCHALRNRIYDAIRDPKKYPDGNRTSTTLARVVAFESNFPEFEPDWWYSSTRVNLEDSIHYKMAQDCSIKKTRWVTCPRSACVTSVRSEYCTKSAQGSPPQDHNCTYTDDTVPVQIKVTKYVVNQQSQTVTELLNKLSWDTLMAVLEQVDRLGEW